MKSIFCFVSLLSCCAAGCQSARVADPLTHSFAGADPQQQLEFFHRLAERPVTSNDEAFHGVLLFVNGQDGASDFAARCQALRAKGMLAQEFAQGPDQAIERGTLAVALVKALTIKGGVIMRLLGPSPRYALREMTFLEIFPPSSPNQTFSGTEFLSVLSKAEEYQTTGGHPGRRDVGELMIPTNPPGVQEPPAPAEHDDARPGARPSPPSPLRL